MKFRVPSEPPPSLIAYQLESGKVLFVHSLPPIPRVESLTDAEQEVLVLLLRGYEAIDIATARNTSPRTIPNQVAGIYRKLGVGSRAELATKVLDACSGAAARGEPSADAPVKASASRT